LARPLGTEEVRRALEEDDVFNDITTALLGDAAHLSAVGILVSQERCVVAGGPIAHQAFAQIGRVEFEQLVDEGAVADPGDVIARVRATASVLLAGERVALNFLQRLCGIATATRRAVDAVASSGAEITDTRKTTPGLRVLEKYAVRVGGGVNHRLSLGDAVLWKDNHWVLFPHGGESLKSALSGVDPGKFVAVEVENEEQLEAALDAGVTRVLVDNQPPDRVAEWVKRCGSDVAVEASGGVTPETAADYARAGARFISIGALTHSVPATAIRFDLSLQGS